MFFHLEDDFCQRNFFNWFHKKKKDKNFFRIFQTKKSFEKYFLKEKSHDQKDNGTVKIAILSRFHLYRVILACLIGPFFKFVHTVNDLDSSRFLFVFEKRGFYCIKICYLESHFKINFIFHNCNSISLILGFKNFILRSFNSPIKLQNPVLNSKRTPVCGHFWKSFSHEIQTQFFNVLSFQAKSEEIGNYEKTWKKEESKLPIKDGISFQNLGGKISKSLWHGTKLWKTNTISSFVYLKSGFAQ